MPEIAESPSRGRIPQSALTRRPGRSRPITSHFATLMLGRGVHPKVVSEMLGHSQISVTLDLYSHVTPTMQREAAEAVDAALR